jgi:hypothetical protein
MEVTEVEEWCRREAVHTRQWRCNMVEQEGAESRSTACKRDSVHHTVEMCYGWTRRV